MNEKEIIELKEVWKYYPVEKVTALKGVNLTIQTGDFVVIMGPSGSGKSTLMNMIGLLDVPTKGKVFFHGRDISKADEDLLSDLRGKKIGFVFQMFNLIPTLTALENVMLPVIFHGKNENTEKRAVELLKSLGMGKRINHLPGQLSGGERQRVAIARALINNPELILADEPTGNLDSKTGEQIMAILDELHHKGKTLVVITHDPRIASYAHTMYSIIDGRITKNHATARKYIWRKT
ncbi:MAG: ABC transporter ATP-binding protein [Candidatus Pacearchaeota archaeon]